MWLKGIAGKVGIVCQLTGRCYSYLGGFPCAVKRSWRTLFYLSVYLFSFVLRFLTLEITLVLKTVQTYLILCVLSSHVETENQCFLCRIEIYISLASGKVWACLQIIILRNSHPTLSPTCSFLWCVTNTISDLVRTVRWMSARARTSGIANLPWSKYVGSQQLTHEFEISGYSF